MGARKRLSRSRRRVPRPYATKSDYTSAADLRAIVYQAGEVSRVRRPNCKDLRCGSLGMQAQR